MTSPEWTDQKLNCLAAQVEQISSQIGHLGQRVEQICGSIDRLVAAITVLQVPVQISTQTPNAQPQEWLNRLSTLEAQVHHLTQRLNDLEPCRDLTPHAVTPTLLEEEDIDDEPDEILWDFMEPSSERPSP